MVFRAKEDFNLDLPNSWMTGDSAPGVRLARNAGLKSIGKGGSDCSIESDCSLDPVPDCICDSLNEAVTLIEQSPRGAAVHA